MGWAKEVRRVFKMGLGHENIGGRLFDSGHGLKNKPLPVWNKERLLGTSAAESETPAADLMASEP